MRRILTPVNGALLAVAALIASACGTDGEAGPATTEPPDTLPGAVATEPTTPPTTEPAVELPSIVVTTSILGDVVSEVVGGLADVQVIMPIGANPHDFAPSARQAESMENADLLIVNGAGFEEGMLRVIEQVQSTGTPVFAFTDHVEMLQFAGHSHSHGDDHGDDDHGHSHGDDHDHSHDDDHGHSHGDDHGHSHDDDHGHSHDDDGHEHDEEKSGEGVPDPHFWTDPQRMIAAVDALGAELAGLDGIDADALAAQVEAYLAELEALDSSMESTLASVPADQRVLVTNHEVFGYFADRFGFEVVGAVIPSVTTSAEPSAAQIEALADLITAEGIPAIFGDTSGSTALAETLARSVGSDVQVVVLFSESLGEPGSGAETYIGMMETNAALVAAALTPA
jgi:zinc/manganese transport system substrate-binding protein